jgi:hypothetical protein
MGGFFYWIIILNITVMPANFKTSKVNQATQSSVHAKKTPHSYVVEWKTQLFICHIIMQNEK